MIEGNRRSLEHPKTKTPQSLDSAGFSLPSLAETEGNSHVRQSPYSIRLLGSSLHVRWYRTEVKLEHIINGPHWVADWCPLPIYPCWISIPDPRNPLEKSSEAKLTTEAIASSAKYARSKSRFDFRLGKARNLVAVCSRCSEAHKAVDFVLR